MAARTDPSRAASILRPSDLERRRDRVKNNLPLRVSAVLQLVVAER